MMNVVMLSVVMLSVIMLSVRAQVKLCIFTLPLIVVGTTEKVSPGNTKGGSITVPLTSCLTGLD
jgi:hypothetical protein